MVRRGCEGPVVLHKGPASPRSTPTPRCARSSTSTCSCPTRLGAGVPARGRVRRGRRPERIRREPAPAPARVAGAPAASGGPRSSELAKVARSTRRCRSCSMRQCRRCSVSTASRRSRRTPGARVAAHAWAHGPFSRVGDLVDVAALDNGLDRRRASATRAPVGARAALANDARDADAVLFDATQPLALHVWARNLPSPRADGSRDPSRPLVGRLLDDESPRRIRAAGEEIGRDVRPHGEEPWRVKLTRARLAFRNARPRSPEHDEAVEGRSGGADDSVALEEPLREIGVVLRTEPCLGRRQPPTSRPRRRAGVRAGSRAGRGPSRTRRTRRAPASRAPSSSIDDR